MDFNDQELEESKGLNFNEINQMRKFGQEMQQRIREVGKLSVDSLAKELEAIFYPNYSLITMPNKEEYWAKRAGIFIDFAKENGLTVDHIINLLQLMSKLSGKVQL